MSNRDNTMELVHLLISICLLLVTLVTGLVFTFFVVVMPGIQSLSNRQYLRAFKVMDRIIQNNDPLFMLVWVGSTLAVIALIPLSFFELQGVERGLAMIAAAIYLCGVQVPTFVFNVPLNNQLQRTDLDAASEEQLSELRAQFETRWVVWNRNRTLVGALTCVLLLVLLLRL